MPSSRRLVQPSLAAIACLLLAACQGPQDKPSGTAELPMPEADLASMEPGARERIESLSSRLRSDSLADVDRASLFGELAQTFHAYKLVDAAQHRWRRIDGHHLVALVRAGAIFIDGELQERSSTDQPDPEDVAA